jgi:anti-anti-sigma factor
MGTVWKFDPVARKVIPLRARRSPAMVSISVVLNVSGPRTIIAIYGDLDIQATYLLRELPGSECERVIFDLHGVSFMDAAGLDAIIGCHNRTRGSGPSPLVSPSIAVTRILDLTGTEQLFSTFDTLDAALAAPLGSPLHTP